MAKDALTTLMQREAEENKSKKVKKSTAKKGSGKKEKKATGKKDKGKESNDE
jgi:hypothetical protein